MKYKLLIALAVFFSVIATVIMNVPSNTSVDCGQGTRGCTSIAGIISKGFPKTYSVTNPDNTPNYFSAAALVENFIVITVVVFFAAFFFNMMFKVFVRLKERF